MTGLELQDINIVQFLKLVQQTNDRMNKTFTKQLV